MLRAGDDSLDLRVESGNPRMNAPVNSVSFTLMTPRQ
jgi:hypothetical protein